MRRIEITKCGSVYQAAIGALPRYCCFGSTPREAIGELVLCWPHSLGLDIEMIEIKTECATLECPGVVMNDPGGRCVECVRKEESRLHQEASLSPR